MSDAANNPPARREPQGRWRCPRCHAALFAGEASLDCRGCGTPYPVVAGIPDLRVPTPCGVDFAADAAEATRLAAATLPLEELVRRALSWRSPEWTADHLDRRTRQSLRAPERLRAELREWLRPCREGPGSVVDAGCGFGGLLAATAEEGIDMIGVDASIVNLVVARRLLEERGHRAHLAAAVVEHLPVGEASVSGVVALDLVEHVRDPAAFFAEAQRVTGPGGFVALSTPNRFSLAAEPHVSIWGVGWLPRAWQPAYVRWRSGLGYSHVRLLSARELRRIARRAGFTCEVAAPAVPAEEIALFAPRRRRLAALYNRLAALRSMRAPLRLVGPFLRVVGRKPVAASAPASPTGL